MTDDHDDRNDKGQFDSDRELTEHTNLLNADLLEKYGGWLTAHSDNDTTVTRRKAGAEAWLAWCEENGHDPLHADENTARAFIRASVNGGLADTTISSRFASVSKFYHWLLTDSTDIDIGIEDNPNADISLTKDYNISNSADYVDVVHREGRKDIIAPSYEALKPIFDHVPGGNGFTKIRNELICRLLWQTAARSDEASRMRRQKLNLDEREIEVRSSKLNREQHPDLYYRKVFYEPNLDYLIHRYLDKRDAKANDDCDRLLVGNRGTGLNPDTISRIVKKAAHRAEIQEPLVTNADGSVQQWLYTAHRLRHARITHLANKTDMDLNFVRMMAGHAKIGTTLQYVNNDWTEARNAYRAATDS